MLKVCYEARNCTNTKITFTHKTGKNERKLLPNISPFYNRVIALSTKEYRYMTARVCARIARTCYLMHNISCSVRSIAISNEVDLIENRLHIQLGVKYEGCATDWSRMLQFIQRGTGLQQRLVYFFVLTLRFLGERGASNQEFGYKVNKVWSKIVPPRNQIKILINDSSLVVLINQLSLIVCLWQLTFCCYNKFLMYGVNYNGMS